MEDFIEAHKFSNNNMPALKKDTLCGCFYCIKIFNPIEISEWIISKSNNCDKLGTAKCPYCGMDSIISESSGYPITDSFLTKMKDHWF